MVSGHGFGHAVRCAEVARELLAAGARVVVRSDAPAWLFPEQVEHVDSPGWPVDVGVVQHDGLEIDIDATRSRWRDFAEHFDTRAEAEARVLQQFGADVVLGDVPPLAFAAAARAGIPSAAMTNFGWDWIYGGWPCFTSTIGTIQRAYARADLLLRLPLHDRDDFQAFRAIEDVPLVARRPRHTRQEIRDELGIPTAETAVLVTFGAFEAQRLNIDALGRWSKYVFVITPPVASQGQPLPPNVKAVMQPPRDFASLIAACDVVVTKPGYGIVSDCLANRVPVLFTDRGAFREYDVLAEALLTLGHARYVSRADLLAGNIGPHLDALLTTPATWTKLNTDGARVVADRLMQLARLAV